jgi:hypothetical protein
MLNTFFRFYGVYPKLFTYKSIEIVRGKQFRNRLICLHRAISANVCSGTTCQAT